MKDIMDDLFKIKGALHLTVRLHLDLQKIVKSKIPANTGDIENKNEINYGDKFITGIEFVEYFRQFALNKDVHLHSVSSVIYTALNILMSRTADFPDIIRCHGLYISLTVIRDRIPLEMPIRGLYHWSRLMKTICTHFYITTRNMQSFHSCKFINVTYKKMILDLISEESNMTCAAKLHLFVFVNRMFVINVLNKDDIKTIGKCLMRILTSMIPYDFISVNGHEIYRCGWNKISYKSHLLNVVSVVTTTLKHLNMHNYFNKFTALIKYRLPKLHLGKEIFWITDTIRFISMAVSDIECYFFTNITSHIILIKNLESFSKYLINLFEIKSFKEVWNYQGMGLFIAHHLGKMISAVTKIYTKLFKNGYDDETVLFNFGGMIYDFYSFPVDLYQYSVIYNMKKSDLKPFLDLLKSRNYRVEAEFYEILSNQVEPIIYRSKPEKSFLDSVTNLIMRTPYVSRETNFRIDEATMIARQIDIRMFTSDVFFKFINAKSIEIDPKLEKKIILWKEENILEN